MGGAVVVFLVIQETKFRMLLAEHRDVVAEVESMRRVGGMSVS